MPTESQLRQRRSSNTRTASTERTSTPQNEGSNFLQRLKPVYPVFKVAGSLLLGLSTAASFSNLSVAVCLFVTTLLTVFISLVLVTMSILREDDQTPVYMPDVHNPDGTVVAQQQMTVKQHDNKVLKYFSRELPALALATTWFYLWTLIKPTFAIYTVFIAFRLLYHPLFRIHLWKEQSNQLGRPFGAVPLFQPDSSVKLVEGDAQLQQHIRSAKEGLVIVDCSATWCAPCKEMAPVFEQLAQQFTEHKFLSVDVDISRDIAANLAITSVPSFLIFKNGQRIELIRGASPEMLRRSIQYYASVTT